MLRHYNIEHKGNYTKSGIGFESYKYATEHQLVGSITFKENNCLIQIEGSAINTAAFISWYLTDVASENINNQVAISSGPVHHCKEFVINNFSDNY